ncbi:MAG: winged helix-turn-helix transcriptional regulator [Saprospiraceae bacterium]|nr:winged helix-turn-helix transcriptional regulator [Candidatus Vicinibacter affinis]
MASKIHKFTKRQELIARFANALANPIRVSILELLANKSCCYHGDLSEEFPIANSTLSQHLKVLKEAGLIQVRSPRPNKVLYNPRIGII